MTAAYILIIFIMMNRIRGSSGETLQQYFGLPIKQSGSAIAALMFAFACSVVFTPIYFSFTNFVVLFAACWVAYKLGESSGWGKWIGQMHGGIADPDSDEGKKNGIHFIANLIFNEVKHTKMYAATALFLRGVLWFAIVYSPLIVAGLIAGLDYSLLVLTSGLAFPLSFYLSTLIDDQYYWKRGETIYGFLQGIAFVLCLSIPLF